VVTITVGKVASEFSVYDIWLFQVTNNLFFHLISFQFFLCWGVETGLVERGWSALHRGVRHLSFIPWN